MLLCNCTCISGYSMLFEIRHPSSNIEMDYPIGFGCVGIFFQISRINKHVGKKECNQWQFLLVWNSHKFVQEYALSWSSAWLLILKPFILRGQPIRDIVVLFQRIFCFTEVRSERMCGITLTEQLSEFLQYQIFFVSVVCGMWEHEDSDSH
jgi:hypothetical protein